MLWSIDTCKNKVSANHYHVTISQAQVYNSSRLHVFLMLTTDQVLVEWVGAHVRLACLKPGRIVWKPANASPGLKFMYLKCFFIAALFHVSKIQIRKLHRIVTKLKSKFYLFLGSEQPGQGAMFLGWPKSIYYITS